VLRKIGCNQKFLRASKFRNCLSHSSMTRPQVPEPGVCVSKHGALLVLCVQVHLFSTSNDRELN
jgi:hypothetical protein